MGGLTLFVQVLLGTGLTGLFNRSDRLGTWLQVSSIGPVCLTGLTGWWLTFVLIVLIYSISFLNAYSPPL